MDGFEMFVGTTGELGLADESDCGGSVGREGEGNRRTREDSPVQS